jgi:CheY-like chemotaxis protein
MPSSPIPVVEDEPAIRHFVTTALSAAGHRVLTATNGAEGLRALERAQPALILLDLRMPVLDGLSFARIFHRSHPHASPIVLMSSEAGAEDLAREIGADAYLSKPFELDELLAIVDRLCRQRPVSSQGASTMGTIALVGFDPDMGYILGRVLERAGHSAHLQDLRPDAPAELPRAQPELVIVRSARASTTLRLLRGLRADPATANIPVVLLGTLAKEAEQARAARLVHAALPMPFSLPDLLEAVESARSRTSFAAPTLPEPPGDGQAAQRAADLLGEAEGILMLAWIQRIRTVEPFRSRGDLSSRGFLDALPNILNGFIVVLGHQQPPPAAVQDPELRRRIREHARTRRAQGIDLQALVREYQVLQRVLRDYLQQEMSAEEVLAAERELDSLFDEFVQTSIGEYLAHS